MKSTDHTGSYFSLHHSLHCCVIHLTQLYPSVSTTSLNQHIFFNDGVNCEPRFDMQLEITRNEFYHNVNRNKNRYCVHRCYQLSTVLKIIQRKMLIFCEHNLQKLGQIHSQNLGTCSDIFITGCKERDWRNNRIHKNQHTE